MELEEIKKLTDQGERELLKSNIRIKNLPAFIWIDSFLSLAGSVLYERENNREPNDIDIIIRAQEKDGKFWVVLDPALRIKIDRILEKRFGNKSVEWIASTYGPNWKALPIYDLALIPRKPGQKIVEINEPEFAEEFYKEEGYEEFCDFGGGYFSKFVKEYPEFNIEEFREYVIVHNKADRDSGELEDIAAPEILRLAKEFAQEKNIQIEKYKHSREECMECDKPPEYEVLWAEGMAHAWFCKEHFKEWVSPDCEEHTGGFDDVDSVKEIKDGVASKKFGGNSNSDIREKLKVELAKGEFYKKLSDKQKEEYDKETATISENKKKPQAKKVHEFKSAEWTHPNGHPRCLICGREEPVGGVCNMPDSWYQKYEFDDEESWEKERKILREKGIIKQGMDWVNSPTFAYQAVYGKLPDGPLRGRSGSPKRIWNGMEIDEHLKDAWMKELNSIPEIEIRASDEGKSAERVAFIVFRMKDPKDDCRVQAISNKLKGMEELYSKYDTGQEDRLRIVVAGKIKHGDEDWEKWWSSLADKIGNVIKEEFEKLDLEEFKAEGIDDDLKNPAVRHKELFADLRYLGNSGYPKLKEGKKWGEWKLEDVLKYYAAVVDCLRSIFYPIIPPKIGEEGYSTSYWQCYRESRKYMKSKPPSENKIKEWDDKRKEIIKKREEIARFVFKKVDKKEFIVGGIVYPCREEDSQGDFANKEEIWKALKNFMIKGGKIKVMHQGVSKNLPVIECFQPEIDTYKGGRDEEHKVKAGDWWLSIYLGNEKDIFERVEKGELSGFSIAGRASSSK